MMLLVIWIALIHTGYSITKEISRIPDANATLECQATEYSLVDVEMLGNGDMVLKPNNITIPVSLFRINGSKVLACSDPQVIDFQSCAKWESDADEFELLTNGSVKYDGKILQAGSFEIENRTLLTCIPSGDYVEEEPRNSSESTQPHDFRHAAEFILPQIGHCISILALIAHLTTFCLLPTLRNLPGYILAFHSIAIMTSFCFSLFGQMPTVVGLPCVISGIMEQYLLMVAFFCMNLMAIDVWKTIRRSTKNFIVTSTEIKPKQFICYALYVWGAPLSITLISLFIEHSRIPALEDYRPLYGKGDKCYMTNAVASLIFVVVPVITLFLLNGVFFSLTSCMIKRNTMQANPEDQQNQSAMRKNFVLYVRLGIIMGVTWFMAVLSAAIGGKTFWLLFSVVNSLQGLYVFILFTCSSKVRKLLFEKYGINYFYPESQRKQSAAIKGTDISMDPLERIRRLKLKVQ